MKLLRTPAIVLTIAACCLPASAMAGLPPATRIPYEGHFKSRPNIAVRFDVVIREGQRKPRIKFETDDVQMPCDDGFTYTTFFEANLNRVGPRRFHDYYDYGGGDENSIEWYKVKARLVEAGKARGFARNFFKLFTHDPVRTCNTGKMAWVAREVRSHRSVLDKASVFAAW